MAMWLPLHHGEDGRDMPGAPFVAGFDSPDDYRRVLPSVSFFSPTMTVHIRPAWPDPAERAEMDQAARWPPRSAPPRARMTPQTTRERGLS